MRSTQHVLATLLIALTAAASLPVAAQTTYKCIVSGKVTYTDEPCDEGTTQVVGRPAMTASATQQQEARERAAREAQRADKVVEQARKRADDAARLRAQIAVAEHRAEEARLKKEAAQLASEKKQDKKMLRSGTPAGFSAKVPQ